MIPIGSMIHYPDLDDGGEYRSLSVSTGLSTLGSVFWSSAPPQSWTNSSSSGFLSVYFWHLSVRKELSIEYT